MKKVFVFLLAASSVAAISSCKKSSSTPSTTARVMFVNGCDASALDLSVNGTKVSNASAIAYLKTSGYQSVPSGTVSVNVLVTNNQTSLVNAGTTTLTAGNNYSIFAGGLTQTGSVFLTADDLTAPSGSLAKVRLVNASSDSAAITAAAGNDTIASNITYTNASGFSQIPAGTYKITAGSSFLNATDTNNVQLNAGKIYTVMYSGNAAAYSLTIIANN